LRPIENCECIVIPGKCLSRTKYSKGENVQNTKAGKEKPKEEPNLDTLKDTRNGGYTIPVQMF